MTEQATIAVWKNANGTFSHRLNPKCEWANEMDCRFDLKLSEQFPS